MGDTVWTRPRKLPGGYWLLPISLVVVGLLLFDLGVPFVVLGLLLAALGPFRRRTVFFRTALATAVSFVVVFFLTAPFSCTVSASLPGASSHYECSGLVPLVRYTGVGTGPSFWLAAGLSVLFAALVGVAIWARTRRTAAPS